MLEKVRINDPSTYLRVAAILVPKEMRLEVEQKNPGGLDADAYAALRRLLDIIQASGVEGEPQQVFEMIEEHLRARMAVPVEPKMISTTRQFWKIIVDAGNPDVIVFP